MIAEMNWKRVLVVLSALFVASGEGRAAIVTFDFGTGSGTNAATPISNGGTPTLGPGNVNGSVTVLTTNNPSSGYATASGNYNSSNAAKTGALITSASGSAYYQFSVTANAGYKLRFGDFDFGIRSTATGPQSFALRSSVDGYVSNIATGSIANNGNWAYKDNHFDMFDASAASLRLYLYNGTGSAPANVVNTQVDDVRLDVSAIATFGPLNVLSRQTLTIAGSGGLYTPAFAPYSSGSLGFVVNGLSAGDASSPVEFVLAYSGNTLTSDAFSNAESFASYTSYAALAAAKPWVGGDVGASSFANLAVGTKFVVLTRTASASSATIDFTTSGVPSGVTPLRIGAIPEPGSLCGMMLLLATQFTRPRRK